MAIWDFLASAISPITQMVDKLTTSDQERLELKNGALEIKGKLLEVQAGIIDKVLGYEKQITDMQAQIIMTEAKSESWITRSWRPITMLTFVALCVWSYVAKAFNVAAPELPPDLWTVIKIGLGGYTITRSAEKIVPAVVSALKTKEEE